MRALLLLMLLLPAASAWTAGSEFDRNQPIDDEDIERRSYDDLQRKAALYRVERSHRLPSASDDAGALYHIEHARRLLEDHDAWLYRWRATRTAERGFKKYPYSSYAGELLNTALDGYLERGKLEDVDDKLVMLWFYLPDYPRMGEAMEKCLAAAETRQKFSASVNLQADEPSEVIRIQGKSSLSDANKIFRFLALHGDREKVAPHAELGLARSQLLSGAKEELYAARRSYEKFLETYPLHELTFTALVEHALSYLVGYRGDDYDNGALVFAAAIIDQAELETHGDEEKSRTVQAYRTRIRSWQQDRDLAVARWYRGRGTLGLQWFKEPPGLTSWQDGARYYYQAVISRDSGSRQAHEAERELKGIPNTPVRVVLPPVPADARR